MRAVEASSRNEAVIQQAQNEVRSAQASIKFLEDELAKLQMGAGSPMRGEPSGSGARQGQSQGQGMMTPSRSGGSGSGGAVMSPSPSRRGEGMERPLPPPPGGQGDGEVRKEMKNFTQLGGLPFQAA
jgi:hypothetical protein